MTDKTAYPLSGVVPIIHTPWTEDDRIDFPSLERLIERSIEDGVSGCIMPAVASEVSKLSDEERTRFVEEVIRIVDGRIHVTAGVSDPDVRRSQRLARHAVEAGADGVLCQAPMDIIEDKEQVKAFMHELAEVDLPMLMIQDLHWNGYGMGLDTIRELWEEIDSFRCLRAGDRAGWVQDDADHRGDGRHDARRHRLVAAAAHRGARPRHELRHHHGHQQAVRPHPPTLPRGEPGRGRRAVQAHPALPRMGAPAHRHIGPLLQALLTPPRPVHDRARPPTESCPSTAHHQRVANEIIDEIIAFEDGLD